MALQAAITKHLGVETDQNEVEDQIEAETDEAQDRADEIAAGIAARSATQPARRNPNPGLPADELDDDESQPAVGAMARAGGQR